MTLHGTLTASDLLRAQWLHIKPRPAYAVVGVALLAAMVWALWYGTARALEDGSAWITWMMWGCLGYFVLLFGVLMPYQTRRAYRQRKDLQRPFTLEVTEPAFVVRTEDALVTKAWSDFLKWKEDRHLFLIYLSDAMFQVVPKRLFASPEAIEAFRATLRSKVKPS